MDINRKDIEIMAPAGSFAALHSAINAGADSVYFGAGHLNMRAKSSINFSLNDLKEIAEICNANDVKSYLTVNTVIYDKNVASVKDVVAIAKESGISAIIAADMAVINATREAGVELHLSTQCNVSNIEAVKFYSNFADVIVLARELNLKQVREITRAIAEENICGPSGKPIKIEMFVHGALCMAISGKCYLSLHEQNASANRGACLQTCRKAYTVTEKESGNQLEIDNEYIMSPKDLCTIGFLDKILLSGARVLKIEGRGRAPEYVDTVTRAYNNALNAIIENRFTPDFIKEQEDKLQTVFNRGFWDGYYLGRKMGEWSKIYGSQATKKKAHLGRCTNYFSNLGVAEFLLQAGELNVGDDVVIIGPTTGTVTSKVEEIHLDHGAVEKAEKGQVFAIKVPVKIRRNDVIYKFVDADPLD